MINHVFKNDASQFNEFSSNTNPKSTPSEIQYWYIEYYDYLYNYGKSKIQNEDQVADIIQETFLAALENLNTFKRRSSGKTWLIGIFKRKIYRAYRDQKMKLRFFNESSGITKTNEMRMANPLTISYIAFEELRDQDRFKQSIELLDSALSTLPPIKKKILTNIYLEKRTVSETCAELKISPQNCYVLAHRGKGMIKQFFNRIWQDE